jgi:hypothetical protein
MDHLRDGKTSMVATGAAMSGLIDGSHERDDGISRPAVRHGRDLQLPGGEIRSSPLSGVGMT